MKPNIALNDKEHDQLEYPTVSYKQGLRVGEVIPISHFQLRKIFSFKICYFFKNKSKSNFKGGVGNLQPNKFDKIKKL